MDESERKGRRPDWMDRTERDNHIAGAAAELAVAKALGVYMEPRINTFKKADLLKNIEIRSTKSDWFAVKVKLLDTSNRIVIAVRQIDDLNWMVLGWMYARDTKKKKWLKDPNGRGRPAYFVPIEFLQPMKTLPIVRVKEV